MEGSGAPPPQTENPFSATAHRDDSVAHLYPPHPRGEFTPPHFTPTPTPGPTLDRAGGEYFVLRPGALDAAVRDVVETLRTDEGHQEEEQTLNIHNAWLLTEVDHWNREAERLVLLSDRSLLICQYDFVGLYCFRILCIPLNYIDRITYGPFHFPGTCLSRRSGAALSIRWDKLQQPSVWQRWNPWSQQIPFLALTDHPAASQGGPQQAVCQLATFRCSLTDAVLRAHRASPLPGRANGPLLLEQPIEMETSLGLLSSLANWSQLGYAKSRGLFGF